MFQIKFEILKLYLYIVRFWARFGFFFVLIVWDYVLTHFNNFTKSFNTGTVLQWCSRFQLFFIYITYQIKILKYFKTASMFIA